MKKNLLRFVLIAFSAVLLIGCRKDDDVSQKNYLKIGYTEYKITSGIIENYGTGTWHQGNNLDLTLVTEGMNIAVSGIDVSYSGNGKAIYFESFSSSSTYLDNGDYVYYSGANPPIKTFDEGLHAQMTNSVGGAETQINSGKFNVVRNADTYQITINCTDASGQAVTGYYKGTLKYVNQN